MISVDPLHPRSFWPRLARAAGTAEKPSVLVFVHGFATTFEDAARRTAQISYDLGFEGAPVFYSWPSVGKHTPTAYTSDENNIGWASPHLAEFLTEIKARSGAEVLHVIAHSMGNRYLAAALDRAMPGLRDRQELPIVHELVLTAPDIDAETFREQIAPRILDAAQRTTLYANSGDKALEMSSQVHGNYPRLGDSAPDVFLMQGVDTIDVSAADTSLLGHSYYGDNRSVMSDLFQLIRHGHPPDDRNLVPERVGRLRFWRFRP